MKDFIIFVLVGAAAIFGIVSCNQSDWYQAQMSERAAEEQRNSTPHVVREADGCKVYAFQTIDDLKWHYFTRCPQSTTTTESPYTVGCGKNCSRTEFESITTESAK